MAGYDRRATAGSQRLIFEGELLGGLIFMIRPATVAALDLMTGLEDFDPVTRVTVGNVRSLRPIAEELARLIVGWNLEDAGAHVEVSPQAFLEHDALFVLAVTMAWVRVTVGVGQVPGDEPDEPEAPFDESLLGESETLDDARPVHDAPDAGDGVAGREVLTA